MNPNALYLLNQRSLTRFAHTDNCAHLKTDLMHELEKAHVGSARAGDLWRDSTREAVNTAKREDPTIALYIST